MVLQYCLILLVIIGTSLSADSIITKRDTQSNVCVEQLTCGGCIAAGRNCGWCVQEGYDDDNKARCDLLENLIPGGCDRNNIVWPEHNITQMKNLDVVDAEDGNDPIQLQPQSMQIKLRPNSPFKFNVTFRQAENYPVDLYFVMDLSYSMKDDKMKLADMGDLLARNMSSITKNFRLGFGSFVDKKTLPYVSMVPSKLETPCNDCAAPYGFKNQMRLTDDTPSFRAQVQAAPISGNLDAPEGGFDAIMQAIACEGEVGWRESSRKMLVYSSDAAFHFAGDGKLGGIVTPNDGNCHLDAEGYYSESLNQDYPSVSQLAHKIAEKKVNIIFAVTSSQVGVYEELMDFVEGSVVGQLAADSSNVVGLVRSNYDLISSVVELKTSGADDVNVIFRSRCSNHNGELLERSSCDQLGIGENVTFEVEIEVQDCPADASQWTKTFSIYPVGLTEKLDVTINLNCECECEQSIYEIRDSVHCNRSGTYECGACTCNEGHYGKNCECDGSNLDSEDYDAVCKQTNTSDVCSGHGQCMCGVCDCSPINSGDSTKRYSGKFCECDDYSCDYYDNKLCAGADRGKCVCGTCQCAPGFKGSACECPISEESCRAKNGMICNGKGTCECGKCVCNIDTFYRGTTCEDCPTCEGRCAQNKACVQCEAHQSGPLSKEYCDANCTFVDVVDHIVDDPQVRKMCRYNDDDDCMFYFAYEYDSDRVLAQQTKECPEPVNVLAIVLGVVLGIVFVGLALLLIWKLLTTIQDRRELASFEKERKNAKWDTGENPIYKQATSTFQNPTYAGKSK